jgi:hypothetical protein
MRERWVCDPAIEAAAVALVKTYDGPGADKAVAVVAQALPGAERHMWVIGQEVITLPGLVLLAYTGAGDPPPGLLGLHEATDRADQFARDYLDALGYAGQTAHVTVDAEARAAMWQGWK